MKTFHGKQKVKIKRIIARLKREYYISKNFDLLIEIDKYYTMLYHTNISKSWFFKKLKK